MEVRQTFFVTLLAPSRSLCEVHAHRVHVDLHGIPVVQRVLQELRCCDPDHRARVLSHSLLTSRRFDPCDHMDVLPAMFFAVIPTTSPAG